MTPERKIDARLALIKAEALLIAAAIEAKLPIAPDYILSPRARELIRGVLDAARADQARDNDG